MAPAPELSAPIAPDAAPVVSVAVPEAAIPASPADMAAPDPAAELSAAV
jgi:hypothetical protein